MAEILKEAAGTGNINRLYESIKADPKVLDDTDAIPFVDTPLHTAASTGHTDFALEILRLKPSFGRKLNADGLSSLHLALINEKFETVKRLIKFDKELIRVKGREGANSLHLIAEKHNNADRIDILAEFLFACPDSIEDQTIRDETALHIAVKTKNQSAVEVILGCLHRIGRVNRMMAKKDEKGNTALHIAVFTSQLEMVKLLVKGLIPNLNEMNLQGKTALDIALEPQTDEARMIVSSLRSKGALESSSDHYSLAKFLKSPERHLEGLVQCKFFMNRVSMELRNIGLTVAVLVATTTFQAVLSPPGGVGSCGDHLLTNGSNVNVAVPSTNNPLYANTSFMNPTLFVPTDDPAKRIVHKDVYIGTSVLTYGDVFLTFYNLNTLAFALSMVMILAVLPPQQFVLLHGALWSVILCYGCSFYLISPSYGYSEIYATASSIFLVLVYMSTIIPHLQFVLDKRVFKRISLRRQRLRMLKRLLESSVGI